MTDPSREELLACPFLRQAFLDGMAWGILQCAEIAATVGPSVSPIGIPSISLHDLRTLIVNSITALTPDFGSNAQAPPEHRTILEMDRERDAPTKGFRP